MVKNLVLILISILVAQLSGAQQTITLEYFAGTQQSGKIQLRWVLSSGQTCNGTSIERSADAINWTEIGDIPGVCGSSSAPVPYNFNDESPINNAINYYRLELGGHGYSNSLSIPFYTYEDKGYVLIPNPVSTRTNLYINSIAEEECIVSIFNIYGSKVYQLEGIGSNISLDVSQLSPGNYLFTVSRKGKKNISGQFIIR